MNTLQALYEIIRSRKNEPVPDSYTCYLFEKGLDKILKKVGEESAETIIAAKNGDSTALVSEVSDCLYHILVLLAQQNVEWQLVEDELERRTRKIGNLKTFRLTDKDS